jgi:S-formylglutathione hydrolase FrmB
MTPTHHGNRLSRMAALSFFLGMSLVAQAEERVRFAEIKSTALGRTLPLAIVVPAKPHPQPEQSPVLFILHGRGRNHRSLLDAPGARTALLAAPFHVALPQGEDGWYIDSPAQANERYGSYLNEIVAWVEHNLPVARSRERRGIAGWSMGGYGAVSFAERHPGSFGFVASVIGLLDFPRAETLPEGQNYRVPVGRFTADPAVWVRFNPLQRVEALRGTTICLVLASEGFERTMNENFLAQLETKQIPVRVHRLEGGHEFSLVERALPLVIADAARFFSRNEHGRERHP